MKNDILHVNSVRYLRDHLLEVEFDTGITKVVDIEPLLTGRVFEPVKDVEFFSKVTVDPVSRTIVWPNGADLAPEALYDLPAVQGVVTS
jgi:hypothetical protein